MNFLANPISASTDQGLTRCKHHLISPAQQSHKKATSGFPGWLNGEESTHQCRRQGFDPWSGRIPQAAEQLGLCATTTEPVL